MTLVDIRILAKEAAMQSRFVFFVVRLNTNLKWIYNETQQNLRSLIVRTRPYSEKDIEDILRIRATEESVNLEADAIAILTKLAGQTSLRYAMQLISTGNVLRERRRGDQVQLN